MNKIQNLKNKVVPSFDNVVSFMLVLCLLTIFINTIANGSLFESKIWISIDAFITALTALIVWSNHNQNKKQMEKVYIYFNDKKLRIDITRKDLTRQELQGLLGILRKNMKVPYDIDYMSQVEYIDSIYQVRIVKSSKLVIQITEDELKQFKDDIYKED